MFRLLSYLPGAAPRACTATALSRKPMRLPDRTSAAGQRAMQYIDRLARAASPPAGKQAIRVLFMGDSLIKTVLRCQYNTMPVGNPQDKPSDGFFAHHRGGACMPEYDVI